MASQNTNSFIVMSNTLWHVFKNGAKYVFLFFQLKSNERHFPHFKIKANKTIYQGENSEHQIKHLEPKKKKLRKACSTRRKDLLLTCFSWDPYGSEAVLSLSSAFRSCNSMVQSISSTTNIDLLAIAISNLLSSELDLNAVSSKS